MELWRRIRPFPNYSVSDEGRVRNEETFRILTQSQNQRGIAVVGMMRDGVQHKRSVAVLVADYFVPRLPNREAFDTPINLDGNRMNNQVSNLMWRTRAFAIKFFDQFNSPHWVTGPIEDIMSGERFHTSWDAVMKYGLLHRDIFLAMRNNTYVWPTYQMFRRI